MSGEQESVYESRWTREYRLGQSTLVVSRVHTGDATVTLAELEREWANWPVRERVDFCQSFCNSGQVPERADILRYIVAHGEHDSWSAVALSAAMELPVEEMLPVLRKWCETCEIGRGSSYYQAVSYTNHPEAHDILKRCLARTWQAPGLTDGADFLNWVAYDAMNCVQYLLKLDESSEQYRAEYNALCGHPCERVRDDTLHWLGRYFEPA